jgi:hypothetical protein
MIQVVQREREIVRDLDPADPYLKKASTLWYEPRAKYCGNENMYI